MANYTNDCDIKCRHMETGKNGWRDVYMCDIANRDIGRDKFNDVCCSLWYDDCSTYKAYHGCYITTAVCNALGLREHNVFLKTIRSLRNKLEQNPNMFRQLEIYDIVGPMIANAINGDEKIAAELLNLSISPVCMDIINGNYNGALLKYTCMTKGLINKYKDSVSIGLDVFKMSDDIGQVKYGNQYKKCLNFGEKFRRY